MVPDLEKVIEVTLSSGNSESKTSVVWLTILGLVFPANQGFFAGPEGDLDGGHGYIFSLQTVLSPKFLRKYFFVVVCKKPGDEPQPGTWSQAVDQLRDHLGGTLAKDESKGRIFGAVAVGKAVRFYEYDEGNLSDMNGDGEAYYIDRQCQTVTRKLEYIREHC